MKMIKRAVAYFSKRLPELVRNGHRRKFVVPLDESVDEASLFFTKNRWPPGPMSVVDV